MASGFALQDGVLAWTVGKSIGGDHIGLVVRLKDDGHVHSGSHSCVELAEEDYEYFEYLGLAMHPQS